LDQAATCFDIIERIEAEFDNPAANDFAHPDRNFGMGHDFTKALVRQCNAIEADLMTLEETFIGRSLLIPFQIGERADYRHGQIEYRLVLEILSRMLSNMGVCWHAEEYFGQLFQTEGPNEVATEVLKTFRRTQFQRARHLRRGLLDIARAIRCELEKQGGATADRENAYSDGHGFVWEP